MDEKEDGLPLSSAKTKCRFRLFPCLTLNGVALPKTQVIQNLWVFLGSQLLLKEQVATMTGLAYMPIGKPYGNQCLNHFPFNLL